MRTAQTQERQQLEARELALATNRVAFDGGDHLRYFRQRGIAEGVVEAAQIGFEAGAFTYPCMAREGGLLAVHCKSKARDGRGKRRQWWKGYASDLPSKGCGKNPKEPAKVIPFGLETLVLLEPGSLVVLCCGEEDALSLRQAGYIALSQPGAGLLEPVYARELAGFEVVVLYDAGEEREAGKDALTLREAGAREVRVVGWPPDALNGADVNGRLVEDPNGFTGWVAGMVAGAGPVSEIGASEPGRGGVPDTYYPSVPVPAETPWPKLEDEAFHGLAGEIVREMEPHSEADPVALLGSLLCAFGNAAGRGAHLRMGADAHHLNLFAAFVGESSKARKGMSWNFVNDLMQVVDDAWTSGRVVTGISSGEGLVYHVRDRREKGTDGREVEVVDEGVSDKRLLSVEPELAGLLKVMARQGSTTSAVVRMAWDGRKLQNLTKNSPDAATDAHVSVVGHITKGELLRHLTETEAANGFANRFLWFMVRRSKELPFGGGWHAVDRTPLAERLRAALLFAGQPFEVGWSEDAKEIWRAVYGPLSEGKPGMLGAVTGRAEAQTVRLAALYAVLDISREIRREHIRAALALWEYAEESARYIFGDATGDPEADAILDALRATKASGLTRTQIRDLFQRNKGAERINQALALLLRTGKAAPVFEETGGRPLERWFVR
jgi:hypothetical protein